jgi:hypothetical protein
MFVEILFYLFDFFIRFFGKDQFQIVPYHGFPVSDYPIDQKIKKI